MSTLELVTIGVTLAALALIPPAAIYWWRHPPRSALGRVAYWSCFGPLLPLGGYLLVGWYVATWGWAAGLWFLGAPLFYGIIKGWPRLPSSTAGQPQSD